MIARTASLVFVLWIQPLDSLTKRSKRREREKEALKKSRVVLRHHPESNSSDGRDYDTVVHTPTQRFRVAIIATKLLDCGGRGESLREGISDESRATPGFLP